MRRAPDAFKHPAGWQSYLDPCFQISFWGFRQFSVMQFSNAASEGNSKTMRQAHAF
jgi:hypothetical protein